MTERQFTRLTAVAVLTPIMLSACADSDSSATGTPDFTTRDSSGVELAVTTFAESAPATGWTIGEEPQVVYGESNDPVQFVWIRGALRLPDRRVVAIDGRTRELFVFDQDGALAARAGGTGDGPGEFQRPSGLVRLGGDTLLVYDSDHLRFTLFDTDGNYLDDRRLEAPEGGADAPRLGIYRAAAASGDTVTLIGEGFGFSSSSSGDWVWENPTLRYRADGTLLGEVAEPTKFWFYGTSEWTDRPYIRRTSAGCGGGRARLRGRPGALRDSRLRSRRWSGPRSPARASAASRHRRNDRAPQE